MSKREKELTFIAGKRKNAVAQVSLVENKKKTGTIFLKYTDKFDAKRVSVQDFFISKTLINRVEKPLLVTKTKDFFDINIKLSGGGISAQANACSLGIARALVKKTPKLRTLLHQHGLLTRDSRVKERKKYGLKKARKAPQFSKR